jgi:uncharacterized protein (DUF362 family)
MEGAWVGDRTERGFAACGYDKISRKYNVPLYDLKKDETLKVKTPIGEMTVCRRPYEADYLISLPVLKGHCQTLMTCALKNSKGCIPDSEKRHFHTMGLHQPIAALATVFKPNLFIVDSICGDLSFEEGGTPIQTNRMMLGHDPVQMDAYGCRLMGIDPMDVDYIHYAEKWGVGSMEIDEQDLVHINDPKDAPAYAAAVKWAEENKLVHENDKAFDPLSEISREQLVSVLYLYAAFKGYDVSVAEETNILSYDDAFAISAYAIPAMQYVVGAGWINGKSISTLNPKDYVTRAEIAVVLERIFG